jgi:hypothetical protein
MRCRAIEDCAEDAVFGVVSEEEYADGDTVVSVLSLQPMCAMHTSEAVHEARSSMSPDEFTVVHIMHAAGDPGRLS